MKGRGPRGGEGGVYVGLLSRSLPFRESSKFTGSTGYLTLLAYLFPSDHSFDAASLLPLLTLDLFDAASLLPLLA